MTAGSDPAVLITGASRGLGRHTAVHLADHGFRVLAGVRSDTAANSPQIAAEVGDCRLAGLVNMAAIAPFGPVEQSTAEDMDATLRTNVLGSAALMQAALPLLRLGGRIVKNINSINGILSAPYAAAYNEREQALAETMSGLVAEPASG